jgi:hypothetical protein
MPESRDLQSSATLPGYRTLPKVCTIVSIKHKACSDHWESSASEKPRKVSFDRTTWEAEGLIGVCKKQELDASTPYCPYHSFATSWWWKSKCTICANIYASRIKSVKADIKNHAVNELNQKTGVLDNVQTVPIPKGIDGHPSHRFPQYPIIPAYPFRRDQTLPDPGHLIEQKPEQTDEAKRLRRRAKACAKYPYCTTRKGTDTDLSAFTGRVLILKNRSGQEVLGRHFTRQTLDRESWH